MNHVPGPVLNSLPNRFLYSPVHSGSYNTFLILLVTNEGKVGTESMKACSKSPELLREQRGARTQARSPCPSLAKLPVIHSLIVKCLLSVDCVLGFVTSIRDSGPMAFPSAVVRQEEGKLVQQALTGRFLTPLYR